MTTETLELMTTRKLHARYKSGTPLTMMTAYDYWNAKHVDAVGIDMVLIGDSIGKVVLGRNTTKSVTISEIAHHARAVRAGVTRALVIVDMPFGSYEINTEQAADSAVELVKSTNVDAVKIEGDRPEAARAIINTGIPVMAHIGPVTDTKEASHALKASQNMAAAGCFAVVFECIPSKVAELITKRVDIPTIGVGSGSNCDGQVLLYHDAVGIRDKSPNFGKRYAEVGEMIRNALDEFRNDVIAGKFPSPEHVVNDMQDSTKWNEFLSLAEKGGNGSRADE